MLDETVSIDGSLEEDLDKLSDILQDARTKHEIWLKVWIEERLEGVSTSPERDSLLRT